MKQNDYPSRIIIESLDKLTGVGEDGNTYNFNISTLADFISNMDVNANKVIEVNFGKTTDSIEVLVNKIPKLSTEGNEVRFFSKTNANNSKEIYVFKKTAGTYGTIGEQVTASDFLKITENIITDIKIGNTAHRPTDFIDGYSRQYFDTTLNKPIWWNGSDWVTSTGSTV